MISLQTYGWNDERIQQWRTVDRQTYVPGRVIADFGMQYKLAMPYEIAAKLSGTAMHKLEATAMPKIGDWVSVEVLDAHTALIHDVLPRSSEIVRGQVGRQLDKQVVAANIDTAFIVQALDHDFSPERLERYIFQLSSQHIRPVIILNKADQEPDIASKLAELEKLNMEVIVLSALRDVSLASLDEYIVPGKTVVILGSSGVGKSTIINRLLGFDRQATQTIRERDSKGRHTTVHRELFVLPSGGLIIDTPGIRELQLWGDVSDLEAAFPDIFGAIAHCHYSNCTHETEDRCAVKAGLEDGTIDPKRYRTYQSFRQELTALDARRGFIADRQTKQTQASAKRRQLRARRSAENDKFIDYQAD